MLSLCLHIYFNVPNYLAGFFSNISQKHLLICNESTCDGDCVFSPPCVLLANPDGVMHADLSISRRATLCRSDSVLCYACVAIPGARSLGELYAPRRDDFGALDTLTTLFFSVSNCVCLEASRLMHYVSSLFRRLARRDYGLVGLHSGRQLIDT